MVDMFLPSLLWSETDSVALNPGNSFRFVLLHRKPPSVSLLGLSVVEISGIGLRL